jgi:hypothetical protein
VRIGDTQDSGCRIEFIFVWVRAEAPEQLAERVGLMSAKRETDLFVVPTAVFEK